LNHQRISEVTQQWFLAEPLLFAAWCSHRVQPNERLESIRVGRGTIEFNPAFLENLDSRQLREVMKFEALRIILKHPYERRRPNAVLAWEASNIALREAAPTTLPMPSAHERFGTREHDGKFFEYYYHLLCETPNKKISCLNEDNGSSQLEPETANGNCTGKSNCKCTTCNGSRKKTGLGNKPGRGESSATAFTHGIAEPNQPYELAAPNVQPPDVSDYCDGDISSVQNAIFWDYDQLVSDQINDLITEIEAGHGWGTIAGSLRELILASRTPKLDYRRVLSAFRATILSNQRRLTRMKPSRRYGFETMGSRRDFTTKILFAVDVSGSVGTSDVRNAFSIVNRLFKYGIESIDVVWFDTQIRNEKPLTLKRARQSVHVTGRGGTCFQTLMDHLDLHRSYDGLIIFTDGIAPVPDPPKRNRRTRIVWLFNHEKNWKELHSGLERPGMLSAFVLAD
jgi:predicted metal-dependent peptidase